MDRPVSERRGERVVDEPVLLDQRQPVEATARDRHLEMVAATGPILDRDLGRVGKRVAQERLERLGGGHRIIVAMGRTRSFLVSFPERLVRSVVAVVSGAVHETAEVVLPRFVRHSRLYEATAKNLLRIAIELVGDVEREPPAGQPDAGELLKRKTAGNVVELGSIVALGFSPLWLLAAASDVTHGSRVYLDSLVCELKRAGLLAEDATAGTVDDVLSALEGTSGTTARLIDLPPLELAQLRTSLAELRTSAGELPSPQELAGLYAGLRRTAARERRPLLDVSTQIGLAVALSARNIGREHVVTPYREDWEPLLEEGLAAYSRRVARPYRDAVAGHLDAEHVSWTDRALARLRR